MIKYDKRAEQRRRREAEKERDRIKTAIPYVIFTIGDSGDENGKTRDVVLCKPAYGKLVVESNGSRTVADNFCVKKVKFLQSDYEYKPSKSVYTGATSGGISMGGFHETQAGYVEHNRSTGSYFITLNINGDENYLIEKITFSDDIKFIVKNQTGFGKTITVYDKEEIAKAVSEAYKMAYELGLDVYQAKSYAESKMVPFYPAKEKANSIKEAVALAIETKTASEIYEEAIDLYNKGTDSSKKDAIYRFKQIVPYKDSVQILNEYEEKEKQMAECTRMQKYENACKWSNSSNVSQVSEAVSIFKELGSYKDAAIRLKGAENNLKNLTAKKTKRGLVIGIPAIAALIGVIMLFVMVIMPNMTYNKAVSLMESGAYDEAIAEFTSLDGAKDSEVLIKECEYLKAVSIMEAGNFEEAIAMFETLGDYKDSSKIIEEAKKKIEEAKKMSIKNSKAGDSIWFGTYEQNGKKSDKESIEWIVLSKEGNRCFVLSKYAIDEEYFNSEGGHTSWETSSLRKWLNDEFYNDAFSESEKQMIATTTVTADKNLRYSTSQGNNTKDKVFLLSISEVERYMTDSELRSCILSRYAHDSNSNNDEWYSPWCLRTMGKNNNYNTFVRNVDNYSIDYLGKSSDYSQSVRPAMWIDLD